MAVWIYTRAGGVWSKTATITSPPGQDRFPTGLALSGDGRTLLVGAARGQDWFAGRRWEGLYAYVRTSTGWLRQAFVDSPAPAGFAAFGQAIASSTTGDTAVIGAPDLNVGRAGRARGAAYVYRCSAGRWRLLTQLGPVERSNIGQAVSVSADGVTVAVGGPHIYVYKRRGTAQWTGFVRTAEFTARFDAPSVCLFGTRLALSANGQTLITAAHLRPLHGIPDAGRGYRFAYSETGWRFGGVLDPIPSTPGRYYGAAVAVDATGRRVLVADYDYKAQSRTIDIYQQPPASS